MRYEGYDSDEAVLNRYKQRAREELAQVERNVRSSYNLEVEVMLALACVGFNATSKAQQYSDRCKGIAPVNIDENTMFVSVNGDDHERCSNPNVGMMICIVLLLIIIAGLVFYLFKPAPSEICKLPLNVPSLCIQVKHNETAVVMTNVMYYNYQPQTLFIGAGSMRYHQIGDVYNLTNQRLIGNVGNQLVIWTVDNCATDDGPFGIFVSYQDRPARCYMNPDPTCY